MRKGGVRAFFPLLAALAILVAYGVAPIAVWGAEAVVPAAAPISAGGAHALALLPDGTVRAWGYNAYGQLGDGTTENRTSPVSVKDLADVVQVAAGDMHSVALKKDGTVWVWGDNRFGELGTDAKTSSSVPLRLEGLDRVVAVSAGYGYSLAVREDGTAWAWGSNEFGQLGAGLPAGNAFLFRPVQVKDLADVVQVAAGISHGNGVHSLALKRDGTVWAWGWNRFGQLGDGTKENRTSPVPVKDLTEVVQVAAGDGHSLALKRDGTVWAWGDNTFGQLGDGTRGARPTPVQVKNLSRVVAIRRRVRHLLRPHGGRRRVGLGVQRVRAAGGRDDGEPRASRSRAGPRAGAGHRRRGQLRLCRARGRKRPGVGGKHLWPVGGLPSGGFCREARRGGGSSTRRGPFGGEACGAFRRST
ncbi:MAG: hypothetical protein KM296_05345 [Brockia lithotrophica]|nr:hypothetical protein [Brockia lithotrophica]